MVQHFELNCLEVCWHIYLNSSIGFFFLFLNCMLESVGGFYLCHVTTIAGPTLMKFV